MKSEKENLTTDVQELQMDTQLHLISSKGTLLNNLGLTIPIKGESLKHTLDKLWDHHIHNICLKVLKNGETRIKTLTKNLNGYPKTLVFIAIPAIINKEIKGVTLHIYDTSFHRQQDQEDNFRHKMSVFSSLASQVVNKMNNPLAAVLNRIGGLLVDDLEKTDKNELRAELESIQNQIYSMSLITNALSAFSQETQNDFKLVNINTVIEKSVALLQLLHVSKKIKYDIVYTPELPQILGSAVTLEQCFVNIFRNAIEAMPDGGILTVSTQIDDKLGDFINVTISDTGIGIAQDKIELVFDPFYSTKNNSHPGLGLSVCYGIILNHNGTIKIDSQINKGTELFILLPVANINKDGD